MTASEPPHPSDAQAPLLSLVGVTKRFPGVVANDDVSLDVFPGEVHALLGENGAGKSTLISLLSGMQRPDAGYIEVHGAPRQILSPRHALELGIGTVYQHPTLVPTLTVLENLMLGSAWTRRMDIAATRARFDELCRTLGIELPGEAVLGSLSLGQQQYVEIIKALWRGERILILDEATSMLTPKGVEDLGRVIARLRDAGMAILFITHKLTEAVAFGDRVSILKLGRKVGAIAPDELKTLDRDAAVERIVDLMFGSRAEAEVDGPRHQRDIDAGRHPVVIEVENLSAHAAPAETRVEGIFFTVHAGEIFGIAGVDGNGQKQLAEALAGQRAISGGTVRLEGQPIEGLSVPQRQRAGLRYVTDDRLGEGTVGSFPVSLNLLLKRIGESPFWRRGVIRHREVDAHARRLIERHDVRTPGPHTAVGRLSGGNIQKALLARELDNQPIAVVYNKPTYGLDVNNIQLARRAIRERADNGVATILISTDLDEILSLSDRIGVMLGGRLVGIVENDEQAQRRVGELMVGARETAA
ncbi:MAG: ABC transporter ATP-binding protein [Azospirillaceae bacterium]